MSGGGGYGILHGIGHSPGEQIPQTTNSDDGICAQLFGTSGSHPGQYELQPGMRGYFQPAAALTAAATALAVTGYVLYQRARPRSYVEVANSSARQTRFGNVPGLPGLPTTQI
jgi:hypothetical protein